jgi:hypothetical protein
VQFSIIISACLFKEDELKECGGNVFINGCLEFLAPEVCTLI